MKAELILRYLSPGSCLQTSWYLKNNGEGEEMGRTISIGPSSPDHPYRRRRSRRLHMNSLEQVRAIFDNGDMGMILIGMPGIEKRIARFPQLYSRIGFVHEFRPLAASEVEGLLERSWTPPGVTLPDSGLTPEVVARIVRMTGGNLRLITRLLEQVERVLNVNDARSSRSKSSKQLGTASSSAKLESQAYDK